MPDHAMTLRLDEATHQRLRKEAYEQCTSITDIVRSAIANQFREWDRDESGPWPVSREATRRVGSCDWPRNRTNSSLDNPPTTN